MFFKVGTCLVALLCTFSIFLDNLQSWSDTWLLKFHPNKCKVISVANTSVDKGTKHYHLYNNDGNRIELEQSDGEKDREYL
jgi:hypothetical protein